MESFNRKLRVTTKKNSQNIRYDLCRKKMQREFSKWVGGPEMKDWMFKILNKIKNNQIQDLGDIPNPIQIDMNNTIMHQRKTISGPPKRSIKPPMSRSIIHDRTRNMDVTNIRNSNKKGSINNTMRHEENIDLSPLQLVRVIFDEFVEQKEQEIDSLYEKKDNILGKQNEGILK